MLKSDPPIVIEQSFSAPIETIWASLTEPDQMRQWFFEVMPDFNAEVGFETSFDIYLDGREFRHQWKVVAAEPSKKLVVNWTYAGYEGSSNVHFEIFEGNESNSVRLSTEVLEDFPQHIPEFKRESAVEGWEYLITDRLDAFLHDNS